MTNTQYISIGLIIIGFVSCLGIKSFDKTDNTRRFKEKQYDFFESFKHNHLADYYYELPFQLKFGGIKPFPFDSIGNKDYSWLRKPENLKIAFNAFLTVGLDKFVSQEKYFKKNNDWCCETDWENKSLNEIVSGFINSDTTSNRNDYYSKFWQRRRLENNLSETFEILSQIDKFYNQGELNLTYKKQNSVLIRLLDFDSKLISSDSTEYKAYTIEYFNYLKLAGLDNSAYKLIYYNHRLGIEKELRDSLIMTMEYDIISNDRCENFNNRDGWITHDYYHNSNRNYRP
ncbi:hypothetical protein [Aureibacter tunicatorum]|uniref:Uncharacterized protein n=1 Tax=Aureibacter tunicatorum TaxID=866807 RepID=A0AAE3XR82_9BACT|nr:hypothetical protein [Aureibacter tunicatorum]MDR6241132.1 hypothetical protein [Aureibacter tunicatorum]